MTSLQRAAAYLKKLGPKAALAIVPLAAATVPAHASLVFTASDGGYTSTAGTPTGAWNISALAGSSIQGIHADGTSSLFVGSGASITFSAGSSGGGTGNFPAKILGVEWDFSIYDPTGHPYTVAYTVVYNINGALTTVDSGVHAIDTTPFNIADVATIEVLLGGPLTSWSSSIQLTFSPDANEQLHLDVAHLDIAGLDAEGVPEPSTFLLAGPLTGLLIFRVRRRKR
jgi:hypothetical protein